MPAVLAIRDLKTHLFLARGVVHAVDGVTLEVGEGETLGIVGESGCGKTMTGLSVLRLLPQHSGRIVAGSIHLDGIDLVPLSEQDMARDYRGRRIAMISQDPNTSLNPVFTIGEQVSGPLRYHGLAKDRHEARRRAIEVLEQVRIPSAAQRFRDYPHQFSGGMRQRVVSAMAIGCSPRLLIADEPTSALDVTIQVQLIALLRQLQQQIGLAIILITHDLGVAAMMCRRVAVMYAGRIVETGDVGTIYRRAVHPYTRALLASVPHLGHKRQRLAAIPGQPPSLIDPPHGCRFAARCPQRMPICGEQYPPETSPNPGHRVSCWLTGT